MRKVFTVLMASALVASVWAQKTYKNPVYGSDFPDPSVERAADGTFYAYATGCKTKKSSNLVNWTNVSGVISRPTWNDTTYVADGATKTDYYSFWACDVSRTDENKYLMYYACALWGNGSRTGIGVATADSPDKFTDQGHLFRSTEIGVTNSIDPVYIEEFDKKYLAWGSFHDIYISELSDDGLKIKDWSKKTKLAGGAFEGTMIYKHGEYYYMFCSVGSCCEGANSTYRTVVGRSTKLLGPYVNKQGGTMINNNYTTIISGNDRWKGPGHNSEIITDDNGDDWLLYHSYDTSNDCNGRLMLLDKITWSSDGWPSINDGHPSSDAMPAPVFYTGNGANLTYRFRNMDLMKSDWKCWTVKKSDDCQLASGKGTAFCPIAYAKAGGTFDVSQSATVSDGLYELSVEDFAAKGGVDLYVNGVATPAYQPASAPSTETVISKYFLRGKYAQKVYGLVVGGKLTFGARSRDTLDAAERFYLGDVKVVYRDKGSAADSTALASVLNSYYQMGDSIQRSGKRFYAAYTAGLNSYKETAEGTTDILTRYNQLLKIYNTMDSINTSISYYEQLEQKIAYMDSMVTVAKAGGYSADLAEQTLQEARDVLQSGAYTNQQLTDLMSRMDSSIHAMLYAYQKGDGTKENPYIISRSEQLDAMREVMVKGQMTYFEMDNDVDMAGYNWKQLNTTEYSSKNWFCLDGKGHLIKNLTPDGTKYYPSFAGTLCGEIRNVGFVDAKVNAASSGAGVICGYMGYSSFKDEEGNMYPVVVENCYVTGDIVSKGYVGAIGGTLNSSPITIRNCYSAVNITGNGGAANYSGGLVGRVRTTLTVENCYAAGTISSPVAGGVVAGGQGTTTPASTYTNVIAWNPSVSGNTASAFGTTAASDALTGVYVYSNLLLNEVAQADGKSDEELQQLAGLWGSPWYKDPTAGNGYPILQWQYDRGDYVQMCGFPEKEPTGINGISGNASGNTIYNLAGQRVGKTGKGVYIVNGKKVLF